MIICKIQIKINGGAIIRLADKRWRIYINGFDRKLILAESDTLQGTWRFLRDEGANP